MKRHELQFPLNHPEHVIDHVAFKERLYKVNAWGHPWIKVGRSVEELWLNLKHGNFSNIGKAFGKRIDRWLGRHKYA
jgi:hypothetical protein